MKGMFMPHLVFVGPDNQHLWGMSYKKWIKPTSSPLRCEFSVWRVRPPPPPLPPNTNHHCTGKIKNKFVQNIAKIRQRNSHNDTDYCRTSWTSLLTEIAQDNNSEMVVVAFERTAVLRIQYTRSVNATRGFRSDSLTRQYRDKLAAVVPHTPPCYICI